SEEFLDLVEGQKGRKRVKYTVRAGDTLKRVGLRFGLTEGDMERINQVGRGTPLTPGQTLVVYLPMSAEERAEFARHLAAPKGGAGGPPPEAPVGAAPPPSTAEAPAEDPPGSPADTAPSDAAPADDAAAPPPSRLPTLPEAVAGDRDDGAPSK